jgi:hypothetical protein
LATGVVWSQASARSISTEKVPGHADEIRSGQA